MIYGFHIEVLIVAGYALLLVTASVILEWLARHSHRRSEHYRNTGFIYKKREDVWQCPTGHHLLREHTDFERKIVRYRAPAHKCNACHCKGDCTDSHTGRMLESRMDSWLQSELRRFHRGVSLTLLSLAVLILVVELVRHHQARELALLAILTALIGYSASKLSVSFFEEKSLKREADPTDALIEDQMKTLKP